MLEWRVSTCQGHPVLLGHLISLTFRGILMIRSQIFLWPLWQQNAGGPSGAGALSREQPGSVPWEARDNGLTLSLPFRIFTYLHG
jgi:hypothetical protein